MFLSTITISAMVRMFVIGTAFTWFLIELSTVAAFRSLSLTTKAPILVVEKFGNSLRRFHDIEITSSSTRNNRFTSLCMAKSSGGITIYGHPGTRSPLINWACYEMGIDFRMADDLGENPHPFGQLPCLTDDNNVIVFESGAILHYLLQKYAKDLTAAELAAITSWITWANASLDPICFLETPAGKVYDTGLRNPNNRRLKQLNNLLSDQNFLVNSAGFTLADVAVGSYLLYVLLFFPNVLDNQFIQAYPAIVRYMKDCVNRPAYGLAFGKNDQARLIQSLSIAKAPAL